jgi:hypothetical protein
VYCSVGCDVNDSNGRLLSLEEKIINKEVLTNLFALNIITIYNHKILKIMIAFLLDFVGESLNLLNDDINVPIRLFKNRTTLNSNFISWKNLIG